MTGFLWSNRYTSRLIILRGNSGSGKTTIARRLQHELGYGTMLIPQDVIRREIVRTKDTPQNPSIQLIHDMATYGHRIGYDVIVEGILVRERYGAMFGDLMSLFDTVHVYYFDISLEETLRRHRTRAKSNEFGKPEMRRWYTAEDRLNVPGEIVVTDDQSEDAIFQSMMRDVQ